MKNIEFDYSKLRGRIKEKFGNYKELKPHINFTTATLSRKLNNKGYFGSDEILELINALDIEPKYAHEYFFKVKVRKDERNKQEA